MCLPLHKTGTSKCAVSIKGNGVDDERVQTIVRAFAPGSVKYNLGIEFACFFLISKFFPVPLELGTELSPVLAPPATPLELGTELVLGTELSPALAPSATPLELDTELSLALAPPATPLDLGIRLSLG